MKNKVLIIDDEKENLDSFTFAFIRDFDIFTAISTKEAELILQQNKIKVVVCDQRMEEEDGTDFIKRVRPQFPDVVFTLLTGYADMELVIAAINLGHIYRFMTKPMLPTEMRQTLENAIEKYDLQQKNISLITELKQKNTELERAFNDLLKAKEIAESNEERFKKLSDLTFEGILIHRNGTVIDANNAFNKMFGYEKDEIIGKNFIDITVLQKYHSLIENKLTQGYAEPYEIEAKTKKGDILPIEIESLNFKYKDELLRVAAVRDLTEKKEQEKRILSTIIDTEEKERDRFSKELHDGLGPLLSTQKMYFHWLSDTNDESKRKIILENGKEILDEAISAVEEISNNITPRILKSFGLVAALANFIDRIKKLNEININFNCNFESRFEQIIEITVYRILTELINNTLKYARADQIDILIEYDEREKKIKSKYHDNGVGFDYQKTIETPKGMGLLNIEHRIKILGGSLDYCSKENNGITVCFECPEILKKE